MIAGMSEEAEATEESTPEKPETFEEILEESLQSPGADPVPLDVRDIPLDEIGETENIRPAYHGIEGLAETMHLQGQLQPCVVRPSPEEATHDKPYELVCGFRRRRAAEFLREKGVSGWDSLRCEVRDIPDNQRIRQTIVENYQREELGDVAEAKAMRMLKFSSDPPLSNVEVARELGCDPSHVSHRLKILELELPKPAPVIEPIKGEEGELPVDDAPATETAAVDNAVDVNAETPAEAQAEPEKEPLDILDLVDKGKISASAAEVIVSLDERDDQEKLAELIVRNDWGVKKASNWARNVKEKTLDPGEDRKLGPVEMLEISDVVPMTRLRPRDDLNESDVARIVLYALIRNGMDREMLEYLDVEMGVAFNQIWDYVAALSDANVAILTRRMALRYVGAAHRWFSLEPTLKDMLGAPEEVPASEPDEDEALRAEAPDPDDV